VISLLLAAYASSPATADALLEELAASQKGFLTRIVNVIPPMLPKVRKVIDEFPVPSSQFLAGI
jgi:hypothetical protein